MSLIKNKVRFMSLLPVLAVSFFCNGSTSSSIFPEVTVQAADYGSNSTTSVAPGPAIQNMEQFIVSYPTSQTTQQADGSFVKQQVFTSRASRNILPSGYQRGLQGASVGFYKLNGEFVSLSGAALLTTPNIDQSTLSTIINEFDSLMNLVSSNNNFVQFFRKIHLNILNELYEYLMNIYTNFNLQHPGSTSTNGNVSVDVTDYLANQETYSTNVKTLIINHLINLIEEQFSGAVTAIMPSVPQLFATKVGKTTVYSDYSVDLTNYILQDVSSDLDSLRSTYLNGLQTYLSFFKNYTALISVADDSTGFSQFCSVAQNIDSVLTTTDMQTMMSKMNPPIFFYNENSMRALRLIPALAKKIPSNTQSIGWPSTLVQAASNKTIVTSSGTSHPIAYFTDASGNVVTSQAQATNLYACIQSGSEFIQEKVLKQPDWLNTEEGILNILRGCMGDFTALLGMGILDCCMETLINNALNPTASSSNEIATTCESLINSYQPVAGSTDTPSPPTVSVPTISIPGQSMPTI